MPNPTGELDRRPLRPGLDRPLKPEFHGSRATSEAGLLAYREADDPFGLARISQCAPRARIASGGRIHPDSCWFDPVAGRRLRRLTGRVEAL